LPVEGGYASKGSDLSAREASEFGHARQQACRNDRSDAGRGAQQGLACGEIGRGGMVVVIAFSILRTSTFSRAI